MCTCLIVCLLGKGVGCEGLGGAEQGRKIKMVWEND